MNLTSMSGGLMLAALAAVWFLVFMPSWMSRTSEREKTRVSSSQARVRETQELAKLSATEQVRVAGKARRATAIGRVSLATAALSTAVLAWTLAIWASMPEVTGWILTSAAVLCFSIAVNRLASRALTSALDSSRTLRSKAAQRRYSVTRAEDVVRARPETTQQQERDPRAWSAPGVPPQIYRGSQGSIEPTRFAEVVELRADESSARDSEQTLEGAALDEILKRRRANG
jgi:hypothetical protein